MERISQWGLAFSIALASVLPGSADNGHAWSAADFDGVIAVGLEGYRDFGNGVRAFSAGSCAKCHRLGEEGVVGGVDLSGAGIRFGPRELLETLFGRLHRELSSPVPESVDDLDEEDVLDLVAYLLSGGRAEHPFFQK